MALFQYFPNNYVWNLAVNMAIESGGQIGEIEDMCRPLLEAGARGVDAGTAEFLAQWVNMADRLLGLASEDEAQGRVLSASRKMQRAALYLLVAERMQGHGHPGRDATFAKAQQVFRHSVDIGRENAERVEIPYQGKVLPALLTRAPTKGPQPCVLYVNGLDSCKELLYWSWLPRELARRGIATLSVDQPGTGEALRLQGLPATHESERWATACYDWLAAHDDIDAERIGMAGISLGGYFTPRAMAFEPRFASGAVWGANHDWAEVQKKRLLREGENPVPHYWNHVQWVFGAKDRDEFFEKAQGMCLDGILDRIRAPFLVTHGEKDRQIALSYAHRSYDQLVNSAKRELKVFTEREGGVEHVGADNMTFARDYIADWFAETLGGSTSGCP
ncbi:MAG TPA: prolyl oligopeptidase family serine peptidase [Pseudomonadaceae bacterium]|nr:prolyl oligopeptidase family serine peptidase [Pseudomonadaceae bacterium]